MGLCGGPVSCGCAITGGEGVNVGGSGTSGDPWVVSAGREWTDHTPSFQNFTAGSAVITSYYRLSSSPTESFCEWWGLIILAADSSITGSLGISWPVAPASILDGCDFFGTYRDDSVPTYYPLTGRPVDSTYVSLGPHLASGTYAAVQIVNATVPVAFASDDRIYWQGTYRT